MVFRIGHGKESLVEASFDWTGTLTQMFFRYFYYVNCIVALASWQIVQEVKMDGVSLWSYPSSHHGSGKLSARKRILELHPFSTLIIMGEWVMFRNHSSFQAQTLLLPVSKWTNDSYHLTMEGVAFTFLVILWIITKIWVLRVMNTYGHPRRCIALFHKKWWEQMDASCSGLAWWPHTAVDWEANMFSSSILT